MADRAGPARARGPTDAREAWEREYAEIRAYTTSYRGDLDRGVHLLLEYLRSSDQRLPEPVLDLGCGMGRNLLPLRAAGYRILGMDHSATALERLREQACAGTSPPTGDSGPRPPEDPGPRGSAGVGPERRGTAGPLWLVRHDLGQPLPVASGAAGTVLDVTAVDNLTDPDRLDRYGREVARVLRPGGMALVVTFGVDDGYYGPWLADSPWASRSVVEDPNTGIRNRLFVPGSLDAVFEPGLRREVATILVFVDDAAGMAWTRRFLVHLYRKPEDQPGSSPS